MKKRQRRPIDSYDGNSFDDPPFGCSNMGEKAKRGRPKGEKKVVYKRLVRPGVVAMLDAILRPSKSLDDNGYAPAPQSGLKGQERPSNEPCIISPNWKKEYLDVALGKSADPVVKAKSSEIGALLDNIEQLEKDKAGLQERVDKMVAGSDNEEIQKLRQRVSELEGKLKAYEQERFG